MDTGLMKLLGVVLFFGGIFFAVYTLYPKARPAKELSDVEEAPVSEESGFILMFRPLYQVFLPIIENLPIAAYRDRMRKFIVTAGLEGQINSNDIVGFQAVCFLIFGLMGHLLFKSYPVTVLFALAGSAYPYLWLFEKKKRRQERIRQSMPDIVDMLSLIVEAGLAFNVAVQRVCQIFKDDDDPFVAELYLMDQNIRLGRSRQEALKTMSQRVDIMEMDSFTSTLIQAEKMGSGISSVLKSQAERMRSERFMKAERVGAAASQKLLVPMMLLIFPTIFLIIFGPYVIQFVLN